MNFEIGARIIMTMHGHWRGYVGTIVRSEGDGIYVVRMDTHNPEYQYRPFLGRDPIYHDTLMVPVHTDNMTVTQPGRYIIEEVPA